MTAKEKVKAKYPNAYAAQDIDGFWHIWCPTVRGTLSGGPHQDTRSATRAWQWAAAIQVPNATEFSRAAQAQDEADAA